MIICTGVLRLLVKALAPYTPPVRSYYSISASIAGTMSDTPSLGAGGSFPEDERFTNHNIPYMAEFPSRPNLLVTFSPMPERERSSVPGQSRTSTSISRDASNRNRRASDRSRSRDAPAHRRRSIRIRSRSPLWWRFWNDESVGSCTICWDDVLLQDAWQCVQCDGVMHVSCVPTTEDGRLSLTQPGSGRGGCPVCGITLERAMSELTRLIPAPRGSVCGLCRYDIRPGQWISRCADCRRNCMAVWHPRCMERRPPDQRRCPGCNNNVREAIRNRTN